ncbi:MAG: hypothetical protein M3N39_06690, partial [Pseudomonadota bacterium]|nr:hypothetical protein [Pseudomonadota bacterium]
MNPKPSWHLASPLTLRSSITNARRFTSRTSDQRGFREANLLPARDFLILVLICLAWGVNNVVSKIVVSHWNLPPFAFVAARFLLVFLVAFPWLFPAPRPRWRMVVVGLLMG